VDHFLPVVGVVRPHPDELAVGLAELDPLFVLTLELARRIPAGVLPDDFHGVQRFLLAAVLLDVHGRGCRLVGGGSGGLTRLSRLLRLQRLRDGEHLSVTGHQALLLPGLLGLVRVVVVEAHPAVELEVGQHLGVGVPAREEEDLFVVVGRQRHVQMQVLDVDSKTNTIRSHKKEKFGKTATYRGRHNIARSQGTG
jgi:hypothetical protein